MTSDTYWMYFWGTVLFLSCIMYGIIALTKWILDSIISLITKGIRRFKK